MQQYSHYLHINYYLESLKTLKNTNTEDANELIAQCYYNLGLTYRGLEDFKNAEKYLIKTLSISPNHYKAQSEYASIKLITRIHSKNNDDTLPQLHENEEINKNEMNSEVKDA